jgi:Fe2+ transport system protein B
MAYFPPFKMFFLLITLSLLVESGLNIQGVNRIKQGQEQFEKGMNQAKAEQEQDKVQEKKKEEKTDKPLTAEEKAREQRIEKLSNKVSNSTEISNWIFEWIYQHLTIVMLIGLLIISGPLYLMFRHSPNIPDLRYSEFFMAMIFTTNMLNIYSIICSLLCFNQLVEVFLYPLAIIPLKQLSGYSYWSTIWRVLVAFICFSVISLSLVFAIGIVGSILYINIG